MPIEGFLNGYYRTGTSIVWWILQQSNPDVVILYEPHSVGLYNEFRTMNPKPDTVNPLHRIPIYKPYFVVEPEIRAKYFANVRPKPVYTKVDFEDAVKSIEMFHTSEKRIIVQSNQLHPILRDIAEFFDSRYVHMVRDPAEVLYSHASSPSKLKAKIQRFLITHAPNFMIKKWMNHGQNGKFELKYMRDIAKRRGWLDGSKDLLEDFVRLYTHYNYEVYVVAKDDKNGLFVRFEDMVKHPSVLEKVAEHLGLKVDKKFVKFDPKRAFRCPKKLREAIRRRCRGEIRRMLEEMGYEEV